MESISIGLLHSLSGTMALSESPLLDAELLAIDIINKTGGILGRDIKPIIEDGASDPSIFYDKAYKLATEDHITTIFGGWNSHTRKAVKKVVEAHNILFWYPMQYEGLEESPNIFYTGSCLNQQIQPALDWCLDQGWQDFYLLGSDYIYPITANMLIKSILKDRDRNILGETYVPLGESDFSSIIDKIYILKPHIILNTLNGDSNINFFRQYHEHGFDPSSYPILSTSVAEHEFKQIGEAAIGHFTCWNYFQCIDTPQNNNFINHFRERYDTNRVVSDPIVMAYSQLFMWKQIVESIASFEVEKIVAHAAGQEFTTPIGHMRMMPNHHCTKPHTYIGKAIQGGNFEIVWKTSQYSQPFPWFGMENLSFPSSHLVKDVMKTFPEMVNLEHMLRNRTSELAASKQRLSGVFETMMEGIIIISPDGKVTQANAEAEHILGLKRTDIIKHDYTFSNRNIIRPDGTSMPSEERASSRVFKGKHPIRDVIIGIVHDDQSVFWITTCATPFINNDGKLEGVIETFSDITQSKHMWDELQKIQRLESLGLLAGGIAHDFNNLLGGIFGNIDLAIYSIDDKNMVIHYLEKGMAALERAKNLTQQLLTFSKGGYPIKTSFAIEPLLKESLSVSLSGSAVSYEVYIEPHIRELVADPNQIRQVLNNMILNARQSMPEGGKLTINVANHRLMENQISGIKEGEYVMISIQDQGTGIPKPLLNKIFDPFYSTKIKGTGLGLSMCYSIITKHNGTILVDSEEGKGTTFHIYLPALISQDRILDASQEIQPCSIPGRILVMDDEEIQRQVTTNMLQQLGYTVICACEGNEAIQLFKKNLQNNTPFDLVLLDLTIHGGIGGVQTMAELRKLDPQITGIVASGYADNPVLSNPTEYLFSAKILKPFRRSELAQVVNKMIMLKKR